MRRIGLDWAADRIDVMEEHRASQLCTAALYELKARARSPGRAGGTTGGRGERGGRLRAVAAAAGTTGVAGRGVGGDQPRRQHAVHELLRGRWRSCGRGWPGSRSRIWWTRRRSCGVTDGCINRRRRQASRWRWAGVPWASHPDADSVHDLRRRTDASGRVRPVRAPAAKSSPTGAAAKGGLVEPRLRHRRIPCTRASATTRGRGRTGTPTC